MMLQLISWSVEVFITAGATLDLSSMPKHYSFFSTLKLKDRPGLFVCVPAVDSKHSIGHFGHANIMHDNAIAQELKQR